MPSVDVTAAAAVIDEARLAGRTLEVEAVDVGELATAYRVQDALTSRRTARGARIVGWKLGYTSEVMRRQLGVQEPNHGPILDTMLLERGATLDAAVLHPRVEPEIGLVLGRDVDGPLAAEDVLDACAEALAVLEVVDSVWSGYRFDLEHNTADGSSAAFVVTGPPLPLEHLADIDVVLYRNGVETGRGVGADAGGHPARALSWLVDQLVAQGRALRAGDLVITGGLAAAVPIEPGDVVHAEFDHGSTSTRRVSVRR